MVTLDSLDCIVLPDERITLHVRAGIGGVLIRGSKHYHVPLDSPVTGVLKSPRRGDDAAVEVRAGRLFPMKQWIYGVTHMRKASLPSPGPGRSWPAGLFAPRVRLEPRAKAMILRRADPRLDGAQRYRRALAQGL